GIRGHIAPMQLKTDALEYMNHNSQVYKDMRRLEQALAGLSVTEVWLKSDKPGVVTDPDVLRGLSHFADSLEKDPHVGAVVGLPTILRTIRYTLGKGDVFPDDDAQLDKLASELETLLPKEKMLGRFVNQPELSQTHLSVITQTVDYERFLQLDAIIHAA